MQSLLPSLTSPPLDVKPRHQPKGQLPPKRKTQAQATPKPPQAQNRPAPDGGPNKKQRLETLLSTAHLHGHTFAWSHTNPNNHSLKCSTCSLFIQQVHPPECFNRLEAQPCAHRPVKDLSKFGLHHSHNFYNMGAVLLCTRCFAVHKPGQLTPFKVVQQPCEGASRAHARRRAFWAQKYLTETTEPANLFGSKGDTTANAKNSSEPAAPPWHSPTADPRHQVSKGAVGSGPHTQNEAASGSVTTPEPADAEQPGRLQSAPGNPASGSSPLSSFPPPSRREVLQEAPAPKPRSRLLGRALSGCGPAPKPPTASFKSKGGTATEARNRSEPAHPAPPSCRPEEDTCHQESKGARGSGSHTQNDVATGSAPTSEPASAEKPGRQQEEASSPARVSSSPPAFLQFPKEEVLQKAPGPKPSSGLFGSAPARCGPGPSLLPKSQPKAKGREDPQPSSQPKLAQFFVAQTRKASTSSHTLASPAHPEPVCPKSSSCQPGPSLPRPPKPKAD